jgi:hypothetical protein
VARTKKMIGTYQYAVQADSTITIGEDFNGGPFGASGTKKVDNSIGAGGTDPHKGHWIRYVAADFNYGLYNGFGCDAGHQKKQADSSNADPFDGSKAPPDNPWGTCRSDPHGLAHVDPAANSSHPGTWNADRSTAKEYSDIASVWGFHFGGTTGFTDHINILWQNYSTRTPAFVCGNQTPVQDSSVLYNNLH